MHLQKLACIWEHAKYSRQNSTKACKQHEERPPGSFYYTWIACISQATRRLGLLLRHHLHFFLYEKVVRMDQLTGRQFHFHVSVRTSVRQMTQAGIPTHPVTQNWRDRMHPRVLGWKVLVLRDAGLAALQPPCAPLGLPASLLLPSYAVALEGIVSGWPHYFPLNQPKEGLSQAQWGWLQQGRAVTHLQHSALALSATILPHSRKKNNILTYIFWDSTQKHLRVLLKMKIKQSWDAAFIAVLEKKSQKKQLMKYRRFGPAK